MSMSRASEMGDRPEGVAPLPRSGGPGNKQTGKRAFKELFVDVTDRGEGVTARAWLLWSEADEE